MNSCPWRLDECGYRCTHTSHSVGGSGQEAVCLCLWTSEFSGTMDQRHPVRDERKDGSSLRGGHGVGLRQWATLRLTSALGHGRNPTRNKCSF